MPESHLFHLDPLIELRIVQLAREIVRPTVTVLQGCTCIHVEDDEGRSWQQSQHLDPAWLLLQNMLPLGIH